MPDERYLVSARKYRPKRFSDLVAQEHVSNTLRNALAQDRLAHAYLFSGPRGVGKTTAARILARAINCTTPLEERNDGEPCGRCEACESFEAGRNLSIIEIDAASNNKVDDVRALREKVRIPPQGTKMKVYIIDEVHMLTNQAFNALLKTLEEPPPHVLFIFATTEPHKVLPTILSRCQRFDFHRIPVDQIVERLRRICQKEEITCDEESLMLIARKGNGALRDALSVFDQAISLCGTELAYDELARALGVVEIDLFFEVTNLIEKRDTAGMIDLVDQIVSRGYDLQEFLHGLAEHLRHLLVANTTGATDLIQASQANKKRYAAAAEIFGESDVLRLLMIVSETDAELKTSTRPRLQVELALLKMAHLERTADLNKLIAKIERLEQLAADEEFDDTPASKPSRDDGATNDSRSSSASQSSSDGKRSASSAENSSRSATSSSSRSSADQPKGKSSHGSENRSSSPSDLLGKPALRERRAGSSTQDGTSEGTSAAAASPSTMQQTATTIVAEPPPSSRSEPATPDGSSSTSSSGAVRSLETVRNIWSRYITTVKKERIHVGSLLDSTQPIRLQQNTLEIGVPDRFHKESLTSERRFLRTVLKHVLQMDLPSLTFVIDRDSSKNENGEPYAEADPFERVEQLRNENPIIQTIFDRFGGEFVY